MIDYLATRPRAKNTVIIVVGDHSDRTEERFSEPMSRLPADAFVWTAALVHGPERLTGVPRRELFSASHVDLLPTILSWIGDDAPRVTFGQDLFAPVPASTRVSVSINGRGYRMDKGDFTMLVDRTNVGTPITYRSFPSGDPQPVPLAQTPFASDRRDAPRPADRLLGDAHRAEPRVASRSRTGRAITLMLLPARNRWPAPAGSGRPARS